MESRFGTTPASLGLPRADLIREAFGPTPCDRVEGEPPYCPTSAVSAAESDPAVAAGGTARTAFVGRADASGARSIAASTVVPAFARHPVEGGIGDRRWLSVPRAARRSRDAQAARGVTPLGRPDDLPSQLAGWGGLYWALALALAAWDE